MTLENTVGIGLRTPHVNHIIETKPKVGWFEVHSENHYADGGPAIKTLEKIREHYPISLHCVGNSLGSSQKIDLVHLKKLKKLIDIIDPFLVSDHISWGAVDGENFNDLLPLPYNKAALKAICDNVSRMQDVLKREVLVENPSAYLAFKDNEMDEPEFINHITKQTGCKLLLDVNNVFVSAQNNAEFEPASYLQKIRKGSVKEIHLAGHSKSTIFDGKKHQEILIDTHNDVVCKEVWAIYNMAINRFGNIPTLIEWDQDIPDFKVLMGEAKKAKNYLKAMASNKEAK